MKFKTRNVKFIWNKKLEVNEIIAWKEIVLPKEIKENGR